MSYRTIVISNRCKLDLKMGYMEVRSEDTKRIHIDDISLLIIENPAVSMTGCLLSALVDKKVKVIFCNDKRNPQFELTPYYGSHDCSRKIRLQTEWSEDIKGVIWTYIVTEKIRKQAQLLELFGHPTESEMLNCYASEMTFRDETNREGHAAKVYFNALFGKDFTRSASITENAALNYGYSLLLSTVNREVAANGYLTQLGLFHGNVFNPFNLSSDLMEPFRIVVDRFVVNSDFKKFESEEKHKMLGVLQETVFINNSSQLLANAIRIYVKSVFDALCEEDPSKILFYEL